MWYDVTMQKQNSEKKRSRSIDAVRKADMILIVGCLLAAVFAGVFFAVHHGAGSIARVSCEGAEVAVISFGESEPGQGERFYLIRNAGEDITMEVSDTYPLLPEEGSFHLLSVADGKVRMAAADCRDQICVRHRPVSADGESIICLPDRFVVEIMGGEDDSRNHPAPAQTVLDESTEEVLDGVVE